MTSSQTDSPRADPRAKIGLSWESPQGKRTVRGYEADLDRYAVGTGGRPFAMLIAPCDLPREIEIDESNVRFRAKQQAAQGS